MTIDEIRRQMGEAGLDTVRLQFTDILGMVKSVSLPLTQLPRAVADGTWFDGSAIEGFARVSESDMVLRPDLDTFAIVPRSGNGHFARVFCSVANPDRSVSETDPRQRLKRILEAAASSGFRYVVAPEIEFFFLTNSSGSQGAPHGADRASYFDQADGPTDGVREEAVRRCTQAGIPVATSHHEVAAGQHEIDLAPLDALAAADAVITVRSIVRDAATDAGLTATFLPKPFTNESGSGMHAHQSLVDLKGKEVFFDGADAYGLSAVAHGFLAGQLEHASGMCALVAPLVNSYKRLGAGFEAPALVSWARINRSAMIRVPAAWQANDLPTRIELRLPDPSANPYLAFGAMLAAGMDGVDRKLLPPEPVEELPSLDFEPGRMTRHRLLKVPASLGAALDALRDDDVMCQALGEPILQHFLNAKEIEYDEYRRQVTPWELARYLPLY